MGEALNWIMSNWTTVAGTAGVVVMGASLMVKAIAPYTKNTADDKAASFLDRAYKWLNKIALNPPQS
jgi:hypothetical protein